MTQNYSNHTRFVPPFHFVALPILAINLIYSIYRVIHIFLWENLLTLLLAVALVLIALFGRLFALSVQDRVIRLEERMRMAQLLPADLRPRINEFEPAQLVALRFASDEELPELARKVLTDKIGERKAIKQMIKNWRADYLRA
jgi:hypothetical protein